MLGFFASKPDHPFSDAREAERALLGLPALDPAAALDNATVWLESLQVTEGFRADRRLDLVMRIDEAVLPQTRRLGREYLMAPRLSRAQEIKGWQLNRGYWAQLVAVYEDLLRRSQSQEKGADTLKPHLPLLYGRLLHAYGSRLKWDQFHYAPLDGEFWLAAGAIYLAAAQNKFLQKMFPLYPGGGGETTPEREYLRLALFQASSMDNLSPVEIEIAERVIAHLLPYFVLHEETGPDMVYWLDPAKPLPPTRLARLPEITLTLRLFGTANALKPLESMRRYIAGNGMLPANVNFGGQYPPRLVQPVLDHLAACWSPRPPLRSHARRRVKSRLSVVHGLAAILDRLYGDPLLTDELAETWVVEDVSQGGMGALVPVAGPDWLRVGALVGLQPEGGSNWLVAVVRRMARSGENMVWVGLETLTKVPLPIVGAGHIINTDAVALDSLVPDTDVRLILSIEAWEAHSPMTVVANGAKYRLHPQDMVEGNHGYAIGRYRTRPA